MRITVLTLFCMCFALLAVCSAETITVNPDGTADFTTIQEGIIAAGIGDTIIVADGTYTGADNRDSVFLGKTITLRSENGPQSCYIDCQGAGRGFLIHNGEGPDLVIDGFTITNGYAVEGGAILCDGSSPTILNCIIVENQAYYGGGVSIKGSTGATIKNCVIAKNICKAAGAGGIDCVNTDLTIINCTIADNSSLGDAGGISLISDSNALITNSILWADSPNEVSIDASSSASITFSDVQGAWPGQGNISADPCFVGSLYAPVIPGLVSHWKFDEGGGSIAFDWAGDNDGVVYGAQWVDGVLEEALNFDASDDYVAVADDPSLRVNQSASFSVCLWAKPYSNRMINSWMLSKMRADGRHGVFGYSLAWQEQTSKFIFIVEDSWHASTYLYSSEVPPGSWYNVAIVYDNKDMKIYVNGRLHNSETFAYDTGETEPDKEFVIGARSFDYIVRDHFDGSIDDVRFYGRALLPDEIDQLSREPGGYHLLPHSPCIDAGDPDYPLYSDETDIDDTKRVVGKAIDMGAYEAHAEISLSSGEFIFRANEGGPNPAEQVLAIQNIGQRILNWHTDADCDRLIVEPNSGRLAGGEIDQVTLSVDISTLGRGVYDCNLTISDPNAPNSPQSIQIRLIVRGPIIKLYGAPVSLGVPVGSTNSGEKTLSIRNDGGGTLNWQADYDCNWLTVEPNNGSSTGEYNSVALSADASGLTEHDYSCDLIISDRAAENNPQTVRVSLHIIANCFPTTAEYANQYAEYMEYVNNGYDPTCWCSEYGTGNQCYGDAAGDRHASGYIIYTTDLNRMANSWKAKIGDSHLNPCADFDHKAHARGYRVYAGDLAILSKNWKRTSLPGDCPLTDAENNAR